MIYGTQPMEGQADVNSKATLQTVNVQLGGLSPTTHGTNATAGVATLASGTVTITTTAVTALAAAGAAGRE